jgi:hypothetical protein
MVSSILGNVGTSPPLALLPVNPRRALRKSAQGESPLGFTQVRSGPFCRGTKILLGYFVDEALIARFSRGFKERCAVYAKYFCEAVPFWE